MPIPQAALLDKFWPLVKDIRVPVVTTRRSDGSLQSRPMSMQNRDGDPLDYLWFFTPRDSDQVSDLQWDSSVSVIFADPANWSYVTVFGSGSVVEDPSRKRSLWSREAESWFPAGPDDAALALVRVRIVKADNWDAKRNILTPIFKLDTSAATGRPSPTDQAAGGILRH